MKKISVLESYNLIRISYNSEIWLKSQPVKIRMLKILMNNIKNMLIREGIKFNKYQMSKDSGRIFFFFNNEDIPKALEILENVLGIYTFSPALRTGTLIKNIIDRTIDISRQILEPNDTFALRVKRSGIHEYNSQEVAIKVGQAVIDNFQDLQLKVNLTNPQKKIYVEIRGQFSYIYTDVIKSKWGGLPIERSKKVLCMDTGRLNDLLAGFLLMRRGCEIFPVLFKLTENENILEIWLSNWKELKKFSPQFDFFVRKINLFKILEQLQSNLTEKKYFCAICRLIRFEILSKMLKESRIVDFKGIKAISDGTSLNFSTFCPNNVDLESISLNYLFSRYPIFTPVISLDSKEIAQFSDKVSKNLKNFEYCQFKPKNQKINTEDLKKLYKTLNLRDLINDCLKNLEEFKII